VGFQSPLDRYGWEVELRFTRWIHPQWKFPGPDALVAQLRHDVARAAALA
jgi:FAD synthase